MKPETTTQASRPTQQITAVALIALMTLSVMAITPTATAEPGSDDAVEGLLEVASTTQDLRDALDTGSLLGSTGIYFEENLGQYHEDVLFKVHGAGQTTWLTRMGAVFDLVDASNESLHAAIFMTLTDATSMLASGVEPTGGVSNHFIGDDPQQWAAGAPHFKEVLVQDVYPDIDLKWYGAEDGLKYDFIVHPGGDPSRIRLDFEGGDMTAGQDGDLVIQTPVGDIVKQAPYTHQGGVEVASQYVAAGSAVSFDVGAYDEGQDLTIDPLLYSTYVGGSTTERAYGIATDSSGNVYVSGQTSSSDYPLKSGIHTHQGDYDVFITKMDAKLSTLTYSTYLGGTGGDYGRGIAVDSGVAYVTGYTASTNFPLAGSSTSNAGGLDVFVSKLSSTGGSLSYSRYFGGSGDEVADDIAVSGGNAFVVGDTDSTIPTTSFAYKTSKPGGDDGFLVKFSSTGSTSYATYLGGSWTDRADGVATDGLGNAYVTGLTDSSNFGVKNAYQSTKSTTSSIFDAFFVKIQPAGTGSSDLLYGTYFGGTDDDTGYAVAVDGNGYAYVTGETYSSNFDLKNAFQTSNAGSPDGYVAKFNPSASGASSLLYSTLLGGGGSDIPLGIAAGTGGLAYVTGQTASTNFPLQNAFQSSLGGGSDMFLSVVDTTKSGTASLDYSTYVGGPDADHGRGIVTGGGKPYIVGWSSGSSPITPGEGTGPDVGSFDESHNGASDVYVARVQPVGLVDPEEFLTSSGWSLTGFWHTTARRSISDSTSLWYGQDTTGNYKSGGQNYGTATSPSFTVPWNNPRLVLHSFYETELFQNYDVKLVQVSTDGGSTWDGNSPPQDSNADYAGSFAQIASASKQWNRESWSLDAYAGDTIKIRLVFDTIDAALNDYEGWYVDNIGLDSDPLTAPGAPTSFVVSCASRGVHASWGAPSSDGGAPITDYKVYWDTISPPTANVETMSATSWTHGPPALAWDTTTRHYQVAAVNAAGLEGPKTSVKSKAPCDLIDPGVTGSGQSFDWSTSVPSLSSLSWTDDYSGLDNVQYRVVEGGSVFTDWTNLPSQPPSGSVGPWSSTWTPSVAEGVNAVSLRGFDLAGNDRLRSNVHEIKYDISDPVGSGGIETTDWSNSNPTLSGGKCFQDAHSGLAANAEYAVGASPGGTGHTGGWVALPVQPSPGRTSLWCPSFQVDGSVLVQGLNYVSLRVEDRLGHDTTEQAYVIRYDPSADDVTPDPVAKTGLGGSLIAEDTWQPDNTPRFEWTEPSSTSPIVGYSYTLTTTGANPGNFVGTTDTFLEAGGDSLVDSFNDGSIDASQWTVSGGGENGNCGSSSSPFALQFSGGSTRSATTRSMDASAGGSVGFHLRIATGSSPCENADAGEDVVLEYSTNGGSTWTNIATYDSEAYGSFTSVSESIPSGAQSASTQFRWRQVVHSGSGFDNWAIDDVNIAAGGGSSGLADDEWFFKVKAKDEAGNWGDTASFKLRVDATDPVISSLSSSTHSDPSRFYNRTSATVSWSASDATSGIKEYRYEVVDGACPSTLSSPTTTTATTATQVVAGGFHKYRFCIEAEDEAGNVGSIQSLNLFVDTAKPVYTNVIPFDGEEIVDPLHEILITYTDEDGGLDPAPSDTIVDVDSVVFRVDGVNIPETWGELCGPGGLFYPTGCRLEVTAGGITYEPLLPWEEGRHEIDVSITDTVAEGGNTATLSSSFFLQCTGSTDTDCDRINDEVENELCSRAVFSEVLIPETEEELGHACRNNDDYRAPAVTFLVPTDVQEGPDADGDGFPQYVRMKRTAVTVDLESAGLLGTGSAPDLVVDVDDGATGDDSDPDVPVQSVVTVPQPIPTGHEIGDDADGDGVPESVTLKMSTVSFDRRNPTNPVTLTPAPDVPVNDVDEDDGDPNVPVQSVVVVPEPVPVFVAQGPDEDGDGVPQHVVVEQAHVTFDRREPLNPVSTTPAQSIFVPLDDGSTGNDADADDPVASVVTVPVPLPYDVELGPDDDNDGVPAYVEVKYRSYTFDRREPLDPLSFEDEPSEFHDIDGGSTGDDNDPDQPAQSTFTVSVPTNGWHNGDGDDDYVPGSVTVEYTDVTVDRTQSNPVSMSTHTETHVLDEDEGDRDNVVPFSLVDRDNDDVPDALEFPICLVEDQGDPVDGSCTSDLQDYTPPNGELAPNPWDMV